MKTIEPVIEIEAGSASDSRVKEIYRNLQILYNTIAGELALDRDFGIDAGIADHPSQNAQALLAAEYVRKTQQYEPRALVKNVTWENSNSPEGLLQPKVVIGIV